MREEPALVRPPRQFDDQQFRLRSARLFASAKRVVIPEFFHQHGLTHAAVAIHSERGRSRCPRMFEQGVEMSEYLNGFGIGDPALSG